MTDTSIPGMPASLYPTIIAPFTAIAPCGDIPGTNGLKGFYCVNGMLKGVDDDGTILYQFNPDSSGFIAKGNIRWDKEGNGDIFNRAIYWDTDGFHFGSGVKLTWDNLDSEVKKNL